MFQNQVYINPAQAIPGDFASSNPMIYKLSGTGRMVADATGVKVGQFACLNADGTVSTLLASAPDPSRVGFVHREWNAQITTFLGEAGYTILPGEPVALFGKGDFWANVNVITGTPVRGAAVYWDVLTGNIIVGAPASPPSTTINTGYVLISETASVGVVVEISNTGA
jgi:hypothetical protein